MSQKSTVYSHAECMSSAGAPAGSLTDSARQIQNLHPPVAVTAERPTRINGLYGHNPRQNQLLASLPTGEFERIENELELVSMPLGMSLANPGVVMTHVYFPTSSIVSLMRDTRDGASIETAVVGHEGMLGFSACQGGAAESGRAVVKSAGYGFRLKAQVVKTECARGATLQNLVMHFMQAMLVQMSQTAVCNRHHSVAQQLCRWLLLCLDRLPSNELSMTQEAIANMLGVRRESIAEAASRLQEDGIVHYSRGHITILDRTRLETRACECYDEVKREYARLLSPLKTHTSSCGC